MAWARLDDGFYDHPKVLSLIEEEPEGWAALGFWCACLAWAHRHTRKPGKTPGHMSRSAVARMDRIRGPAYAGLLVKHGLWELHRDGDGWLIHDFQEFLPSPELSAVRARAGAQGGRKKAANASVASSELQSSSSELATSSKPPSKRLANAGSGTGSSNSDPLSPILVRPSGTELRSVPLLSELSDSDKSGKNRLDQPGQRDDVERLCQHLADRIEQQTGARPNVGVQWRRAARLLLDADHRTEAQVHAAIDWCQDDEFWRSNVLSMSKLREKYIQLRAAAQRNPRSAVPDDRLGGRVEGTAGRRAAQILEAERRIEERNQGKQAELE